MWIKQKRLTLLSLLANTAKLPGKPRLLPNMYLPPLLSVRHLIWNVPTHQSNLEPETLGGGQTRFFQFKLL